MEALFIVLNHESHLDKLLHELSEQGFTRGTILESQGLAATLAQFSHEFGIGYLRQVMNEGRPYNKTIFFILKDSDIERVKEIAREVTGGLDHENTGLMFTLPVTSVEGLGNVDEEAR
ncbi:MAG: hypothetical protein Q4P65_02810 [Eubacteriales bacterium]|nr:hypothetical protein [Eubacteriales bacterium]